MSDENGEKTELPTQRKLEEAIKHGQFPRSAEVQTVAVLFGSLMALQFTGHALWDQLANVQIAIFGHLSEIPLTANAMQGYAARSALVFAACVAPVVLTCMVSGVVIGAVQSRFQTASEALEFNWERVNPLAGFKRIFSGKSLVPAGLSMAKLAVIGAFSQGRVKQIIDDPIFYTAVDVSRISEFLAQAAMKIIVSIGMSLAVIAAIDYTYQFWKTGKDLMMTKEEVKEEMKSMEGNPHVKAKMRRRRPAKTQRQMLQDVAHADVIVTNPTHIAVALRYDRKTMKAPKIVAKGTRLNALRIREVAGQHQIPIIENKPLARMMFKYGKVGSEIPAQLYAAVAEILAYVYRINRFRYYAEQNQA